MVVDIVLQKTVPCKVALLVVLLNSTLMANAMAPCVGAEVHPEVVVAARCKRNREHVSGVGGCGVLVTRSDRSGLCESSVS